MIHILPLVLELKYNVSNKKKKKKKMQTLQYCASFLAAVMTQFLCRDPPRFILS